MFPAKMNIDGILYVPKKPQNVIYIIFLHPHILTYCNATGSRVKYSSNNVLVPLFVFLIFIFCENEIFGYYQSNEDYDTPKHHSDEIKISYL